MKVNVKTDSPIQKTQLGFSNKDKHNCDYNSRGSLPFFLNLTEQFLFCAQVSRLYTTLMGWGWGESQCGAL